MKVLVTPKISPDLDGVSCALSYAELLKQKGINAQGKVYGNVQAEVEYFIKKHGIKIGYEKDKESNEYDEFVIVDASSMMGMPKPVRKERVVEVIDHRELTGENEFPKARIQNEMVGAAATLITERFMHSNYRMPVDHAKLLYGAIYHNSLNFTSTNTTQRDKVAAQYLEKEYGLNNKLVKEMFEYATKKIGENLLPAILDDSKEINAEYKVGALQLVAYGSALNKNLIEQAVAQASKKLGYKWSFLNLVDMETRTSKVYSQEEGVKIVEEALKSSAKNGWIQLNPPWLRKQIMPRVKEALNIKKN